jgi:CheY-like chemotaxis protein
MSSVAILIVDDNPSNLKLLQVLLGNQGYDIHTAVNAEQTLASLRKVRPRIILMDLQLPGTDGLTLTRQLKADALYRDIIVIAVTASAMKGDEDKAMAAGCDGYITKPVDTRNLPKVIASYLEADAQPH